MTRTSTDEKELDKMTWISAISIYFSNASLILYILTLIIFLSNITGYFLFAGFDFLCPSNVNSSPLGIKFWFDKRFINELFGIQCSIFNSIHGYSSK